MKLKIKVQGEEKEVIVSGLKGKHRKNFLKMMQGIAEKTKKDNLSAVQDAIEFLDYQDDLAVEVTDLSKEEFENLDLEEANKILNAISKILFPQSEGKNLF
ncbi:hypothetical protein LCGC14_1048300 [marine sediment metagenome]|uniref:Uncharacterized protein n=1 Tax=marine sediment metagenome TaxID=412755 RepID=A0A0F9Q7V1_9ZZZZ